jgi:hypothetical protein
VSHLKGTTVVASSEVNLTILIPEKKAAGNLKSRYNLNLKEFFTRFEN